MSPRSAAPQTALRGQTLSRPRPPSSPRSQLPLPRRVPNSTNRPRPPPPLKPPTGSDLPRCHIGNRYGRGSGVAAAAEKRYRGRHTRLIRHLKGRLPGTAEFIHIGAKVHQRLNHLPMTAECCHVQR